MLHYRKGENIEEEIKKDDLPFDDCMPKGQKEFLWMRVKGGTKVGNVVTYAKDALDKGEYRNVVWSGVGGGVIKTISCAEILKRTHPLYQVTRMAYTNIQEHWLPQMEGLDEIVANRQIPCLHILMSLDEIDDTVEGLQKPNTKTDFFASAESSNFSNRQGHGQSGSRGSNRGGQQRHKNPNQAQRGAGGGGEQQQQQQQQQSAKKPKPRSQAQAQEAAPLGEQQNQNIRKSNDFNQKKNQRNSKPQKNNSNRPHTSSAQQQATSQSTQAQSINEQMQTP